mmetsp:Transcript_24019/g.60100  ORF Transcript_24019/g.60100 Transcript_24019/m.60100 type:complete len:201 (-) Transcript_24019:1421-2023(-)
MAMVKLDEVWSAAPSEEKDELVVVHHIVLKQVVERHTPNQVCALHGNRASAKKTACNVSAVVGGDALDILASCGSQWVILGPSRAYHKQALISNPCNNFLQPRPCRQAGQVARWNVLRLLGGIFRCFFVSEHWVVENVPFSICTVDPKEVPAWRASKRVLSSRLIQPFPLEKHQQIVLGNTQFCTVGSMHPVHRTRDFSV